MYVIDGCVILYLTNVCYINTDHIVSYYIYIVSSTVSIQTNKLYDLRKLKTKTDQMYGGSIYQHFYKNVRIVIVLIYGVSHISKLLQPITMDL